MGTRGRVRSPELNPIPRKGRSGAPRAMLIVTTRSESAFHLIRFDSREQWHRFANDMPIRQTAPLRILEPKSLLFSTQFHLPIQLIENSMRCPRHDGRYQNSNDANRLG